jgi:acyl-CoA synthetase (AMP-forming)/AMP-acid ligase II
VGEIWVSGPHIAQGYWNRAEETERTFHAFLADTGEGPFLRTGDLGFIKDGELYIAGRLKDLIIVDGRNHYPQDIEETVERSHPSIRPGCCASFSIDADCGESLVIVAEVDRWRRTGRRNGATADGAVPQPGLPPRPDSIVQIVRRAVAEHHDLYAHSVCLVNVGSVPKTSSGKLRRSACRSAFLAGELATLGNE